MNLIGVVHQTHGIVSSWIAWPAFAIVAVSYPFILDAIWKKYFEKTKD